MLGSKVTCPNIVPILDFSYSPPRPVGEDNVCGYEGYEVLGENIYSADSGYDPLICRVKCRKCGYIYFVAPAPYYKEEK